MKTDSKDTELLTPEQRWGNRWDILLIFIAVLGILAGFATFCVTAYEKYLMEDYTYIPAYMMLVMVALIIWMRIIQFVDKVVRRRWLFSYVIDESDPNVVKLFGSVRLQDVEHIKNRLLSVRSNYRMEQNAHELYGCTMAAVPASEEHLAARAELKEWGIKV